jgi:hypothetical protein
MPRHRNTKAIIPPKKYSEFCYKEKANEEYKKYREGIGCCYRLVLPSSIGSGFSGATGSDGSDSPADCGRYFHRQPGFGHLYR